MRQDCAKIDTEKLKKVSSQFSNLGDIAASLGMKKNQLRYLLYCKCDPKEDKYTQKVKDAYYEGKEIFRKKRV